MRLIIDILCVSTCSLLIFLIYQLIVAKPEPTLIREVPSHKFIVNCRDQEVKGWCTAQRMSKETWMHLQKTN